MVYHTAKNVYKKSIPLQVRFFENAVDTDGIEYLSSETVEVKLLTQTSAGILDAAIAPVEQITIAHRQIRSYLPGKITVNGVLYPDSITTSDRYILSFAHRDRLLQSDRLVDCLSESIGPEPGTIYSIEITDSTNTLVWQSSMTDSLIALPYSTDYDFDNAAHTLTLYSVRNGFESLHRFTVDLPVGHIVISEPENGGAQ